MMGDEKIHLGEMGDKNRYPSNFSSNRMNGLQRRYNRIGKCNS